MVAGAPGTGAEISLQPVEVLEEIVVSRCLPAARGGPHTGAGEKCEEEGAAERNCYGLTATPNAPAPLHHLELRGEEEELGRKE